MTRGHLTAASVRLLRLLTSIMAGAPSRCLIYQELTADNVLDRQFTNVAKQELDRLRNQQA